MEHNSEYIHGFNNGYFLAKFESDLLIKVIQYLKPTGDYLEGFFSGKEEFELELTHKELDDLTHLRNRLEDRDHNLEL